jgi:hypothetical protein
MLSGIGPADQLRAHGIQVRVDLPGVGQNLQDHLQLPVVYFSKIELPATKTLCGNILFAKTRPGMGMESPDLQMIFSPTVPGPLAAVLQFPAPVCIFIPILVRPFSRGEVRLRSANPRDLAIVDPHYLECDADVQTLVKGVGLVRRLAATRAFAEVNGGPMVPGPDDDLVSVTLRGEFRADERVDLAYLEAPDFLLGRRTDLPVDGERGEVVLVERGEAVRTLPAQRLRLALYGVSPSGQRTIGEYTLLHAPWPGAGT